MARPAGHALNQSAFDDLLLIRRTTLTELAETSKIARPTLSSLVAGNHRASLPMADRLATALGVNVETLFPTVCARFAPAARKTEQAA